MENLKVIMEDNDQHKKDKGMECEQEKVQEGQNQDMMEEEEFRIDKKYLPKCILPKEKI